MTTSKERSIFDFSWNVVNCIFAAWRRIRQPELLSHSCCSFFGYLCCSVMCHLVQREEMNAEEAHWTFFFFVNAQQLLRSMTESLIYLLRIWHEAQSCSYLYIETVKKKKIAVVLFPREQPLFTSPGPVNHTIPPGHISLWSFYEEPASLLARSPRSENHTVLRGAQQWSFGRCVCLKTVNNLMSNMTIWWLSTPTVTESHHGKIHVT